VSADKPGHNIYLCLSALAQRPLHLILAIQFF
jgi:hypothetical protein